MGPRHGDAGAARALGVDVNGDGVRNAVLAAASGHILARAIHTAVELGLADRLSAKPKTALALAAECGADPKAIRRLTRFLARHGFLVEDGDRLALSETGAMLRSDADGRTAAVIRSLGSPEVWKAFERLPQAMIDGLPSEKRRGGRVYAPGGNAAEEIAFGEAMAGYHWGEAAAIARAYDFSSAARVIDVGGSSGGLLAAILTEHPRVEGLVFDRPGIAEHARARFKEAGLADRASFRGGDFFDWVPSGGDVYILSHILHDWGDEDARAILASCRKATGPDARLIVAEALLESAEEQEYPIPADMLLLANTEGGLRTRSELEALLAASGFRLERILKTAAAVSLAEAVPA